MKGPLRILALWWLVLAAGCSASPRVSPDESFAGTWCWGSPRRSAEVPFLRISRDGGRWQVRTKHYLHDNFVDTTRDVHVEGKNLRFTYWYEPLSRPSTCVLLLSGDRMDGTCEGEINARQWGDVPSFLWRQGP